MTAHLLQLLRIPPVLCTWQSPIGFLVTQCSNDLKRINGPAHYAALDITFENSCEEENFGIGPIVHSLD